MSETLTADRVEPPVTLVKTLGDAVMLVSPERDPLLDLLLDLVDAAEADDQLPMLRVGVACGPALERGGDWYGRPVNLASRLTGLARPASVVATAEVRDATPDLRWSALRARKVRGVGEMKLFRARRPEAEGAG